MTHEPATLSLLSFPVVSQLFGFCGRRWIKSLNLSGMELYKAMIFCQAFPCNQCCAETRAFQSCCARCPGTHKPRQHRCIRIQLFPSSATLQMCAFPSQLRFCVTAGEAIGCNRLAAGERSAWGVSGLAEVFQKRPLHSYLCF